MERLLKWLAGGLLAGFALKFLLEDDHPDAFISFAAEDSGYRDYLVGQAKNEKVAFKMNDLSLHEPFSTAWKTQTREIIRNCDFVIVMIGKTTWRAEGVLWEIQAALDEGIPVFGIHINKRPPSRVPKIMRNHRIKVIAWKHAGILREFKKALRDSESQKRPS